MKSVKYVLLVGGIVGLSFVLQAQQAPPDTILTNGKIITVDDTFSIAQAVALRDSRIVAVGTNQEITRLAGPKHAADRPPRPIGGAGVHRQPRALPGRGRVLDARAAP